MHEPQGPLPREVYVRRRVAAVVIAVVAVLVVVLALFLASRDSGTDTQESAAGATGSSEAAETTRTSESESEAETSTEREDDGGASRGRCADEDLRLDVWPAEPNVPVGQEVRFYVNVLNASETTCDRDLSEAPLSFEIYRLDDNTKIWSSIDCTTPRGEDEVELRPQEPESRMIDWSGRRSAEDACSEAHRTVVGVGSYQVYALVGNVFSPAATFNIVEGPAA